MMIIIRSQDDAATAAAIERALKGQDIEILQHEDEELTMEDIGAALVNNVKQGKIYIGRLERQLRHIEENSRRLSTTLEPLSTLATLLLADMDGTVEDQLVERFKREEVVAKASVLTGRTKLLGDANERT